MSYALSGCLIDLEKLRSAVRGRDRGLIKTVMEASPEDFAATPGKDEVSLKDALTHLIMGYTIDKRSAHQYGYALELLCSHLGARLESTLWNSSHWDAIEAAGVERIIDESGPPVPLPEIRYLPSIGHIPAERMQTVLNTFQERIDSETDQDLREMLIDFEGWLQVAVEQHKSLVLFYY